MKSARKGCERGTGAAIAGSAHGAAGFTGGFDLLVSPHVRLGCWSVFFRAADFALMLFFKAFVHNRLFIINRLPNI
jgi:hypothetical protein